jgi:Cupin domain
MYRMHWRIPAGFGKLRADGMPTIRSESMQGKVRRVVTGQSVSGKATITSDALAPLVFPLAGGPTIVELWKTHATPAHIRADEEEPAAGPLSLLPPKNGTVLRIAEFPPDAPALSAEAGRAMFEKMGSGSSSTSAAAHDALMHRTQTLDYGIVLEGEITLLVDTAETTLAAGDVVIQRGANHAWSNRSGRMCRMAFVLIDGRWSHE